MGEAAVVREMVVAVSDGGDSGSDGNGGGGSHI